MGRGGTVWNNPAVHPYDQEFWQWLPESQATSLTEWASNVQLDFFVSRLPQPSILYNLDVGIGDRWAASDPGSWELVRDLHECTLHALRRATQPDEWIYAIADPEASYEYCYRFWPHRATEKGRWYVSPVPDGDHQFFVSQDFQWGILGLFYSGLSSGPESPPGWALCVFGQRLLDAFAVEPPQSFRMP